MADKYNAMLTRLYGAGDFSTRFNQWLADRGFSHGDKNQFFKGYTEGSKSAVDGRIAYWGDDVLSDAVLWLEAGLSRTTGGKLTNLGTGGSALDAQYGSTSGADTNDPLLLPHTGENYLYLPINGQLNYAQAPSIPAYNFPGDFELVLRLNCEDWTIAGQSLICRDGSAPNRGWCLFINAGGSMRLTVSTDGTTIISNIANAGVQTVVPSGTNGWVRATYKASTGDTTFYASLDTGSEPTVWTQLGTVINSGAGAVTGAANAPLDIGNRSNNLLPFGGRIYRAIARNGLSGGTTVFDADFTKGITTGATTTFTERSPNAATVTISRATSGRKSVAVARSVLLLGTDDYLEVPDNALINIGATDSLTLIAVARDYGTPGASARFVDKWGGGASAGYALTHTGTNAQLTSFTEDANLVQFQQTAQAYAFGRLNCFSLVFDRTAGNVKGYVNNAPSTGTSIAAAVSLTNAVPLRIGMNATSLAANGDLEVVAVAMWKRALSAAEIAQLVSRYGAG